MTIAPAILKHYPDLNEAQGSVVGHLEGPLLMIAGPGSGKTYSIVLRALNLLLLGKAEAKELVLCTFTEKAAFEMRDRLAAAARKVGYTGDLSALTVSTIHRRRFSRVNVAARFERRVRRCGGISTSMIDVASSGR